MRSALASGESLVTITGLGGIGKSRFVAEIAERFASDFDASIVCDLSEARSRAELFDALGRALGCLGAQRESTAVTVIAAALGQRGSALLVLDNFEQLVAIATDVVEALLVQCPEARLLVASRERLRLDGELVFALEPLALPRSASDASSAAAVALFVDRARRARREFALTESNADAVVALVRALDGIPLAIELAAARAALLDVRAMHARLDARLEWLSHGSRTASPRQSTMRGALDWSWNLLSPDDRLAFARCAVFRGAFDLTAAERVLADGRRAAVMDTLQSLLDQSLLRTRALPDGSDGFDLFLTVREYASEQLAALDPAQSTREAHARYFAERARAALAHRSPVQWLANDRENMLAAIEHALAHGPTDALWAVLALDVTLSGHAFDAPSAVLDEAIARVQRDAAADQHLLGWLRYLRVRSRALERGSYSDSERDDALFAVSVARTTGDRALESSAHRATAHLRLAGQRVEDALESAVAAVDALDPDASPALRGAAASTLGSVLVACGQLDRAAVTLERALALHEQSGHEIYQGLTRAVLGVVCVERGDVERARACLLPQSEGRDRSAAHAHGYLALLAHDQGALEDALAHYAQAAARFEEHGAAAYGASFAAYTALLWIERGEPSRARAAIERSIARIEEERSSLGIVPLLAAAVEAACGDREAALRQFDAIEAEYRANSDRSLPVLLVLRELVTLSSARAAERAGDGAAARALRERSLLTLDAHAPESARMVVLRVALRTVRAAMAQTGAPVPANDADPRATEALVVHSAGDWFDPPGGERVELYARPVLRGLLRALVRSYAADPHAALPNSALIAAGWPGQKMKPESARARLHTALKVLRQLGLKDHLRAVSGGYVLDPGQAMVVQ